MTSPPSIPQPLRPAVKLRHQVLLWFILAVGVGLISLRPLGLVRPFKVPTGAMTPAISPGDHLMMEGIQYLARKPRRGDIAIFRVDGIAQLPPGHIYVMRVAGEPGERLRISEGKLYVNGVHAPLRNRAGEIQYVSPTGAQILPAGAEVTVPEGHYFVLGDNSANSLDSRYWGFVPARDIIGRASFCYWPPGRMGGIK